MNDLPACRGDGHPFVVDADGRRWLQFDALAIQSEMALDDPNGLALEYTRAMMGFLLFRPAPRHITMIGLGRRLAGQILPRRAPGHGGHRRRDQPGSHRPARGVRDPAGRPRLRVVCRDGAEYVRDPDEVSDVLIVDGFDLAGMPRQLSSAGFYDHCWAMLAEGGMMVVNLWSEDSRYGLYASRIRDSFDDRVVVVRAQEDSNRIVFASKDTQFPPSRNLLSARARALAAAHPIGLVSLAQRLQLGLDRRRRQRHDEWLAGGLAGARRR